MEARGTSGGKFRSGSMAFRFPIRAAGVFDFRAQPSANPEDVKYGWSGATTSNLHTPFSEVAALLGYIPSENPRDSGAASMCRRRWRIFAEVPSGANVDHRLNQPMAAGRSARKLGDAVIVALTLFNVLGTDAERDRCLGAPAVLREEQAQ